MLVSSHRLSNAILILSCKKQIHEGADEENRFLGGYHPGGHRPCVGTIDQILRRIPSPSPLLDTLFALQEFVYKCALFAERAHSFLIGATLSPLSVIVNFGGSQIRLTKTI